MRRKLSIFCFFLIAVLTLSGCRTEWVWSFGEKVALTNGRNGLTENEIRVIALEYKCLFESYYKELLGEQFWDREVFEGETYEDYIKSEYILEEARALLYLNSVSDERNVSLTDSEREKIRTEARAYYDGYLTDDEKQFIRSDRDMLEQVLLKYALASKVVSDLVKDGKLEVSDEESRVSDVMVIRVVSRELADELSDRILNGENFATLAAMYSEDPEIEYSVSRSDLNDEIRDVIFALKDGEISQVIEYEGNYYLFRNVNSYNVLLSNKEKTNLMAARRYENWNALYEAFMKEHEEKIQLSFWNALRLNEPGDYTYRKSLFSCLSE